MCTQTLRDYERTLIVEMQEDGIKCGHINDLMEMPRSTVSIVLTKWKKFGCATTSKPKPKPKKLLDHLYEHEFSRFALRSWFWCEMDCISILFPKIHAV